jgi:hypothetical protein
MEAMFTAGGEYDAAQNKDVARKFRQITFPQVNPYTVECDYFAQCVLDGTGPDLNDGTNAVAIAELVEKAYHGQAVSHGRTTPAGDRSCNNPDHSAPRRYL